MTSTTPLQRSAKTIKHEVRSDDVYAIDLTEAETTRVLPAAHRCTVGRKRRSEEFEEDVPFGHRPNGNAPEESEFTSIDDILESSPQPPKAPQLSSDPPPPYSTMPLAPFPAFAVHPRPREATGAYRPAGPEGVLVSPVRPLPEREGSNTKKRRKSLTRTASEISHGDYEVTRRRIKESPVKPKAEPASSGGRQITPIARTTRVVADSDDDMEHTPWESTSKLRWNSSGNMNAEQSPSRSRVAISKPSPVKLKSQGSPIHFKLSPQATARIAAHHPESVSVLPKEQTPSVVSQSTLTPSEHDSEQEALKTFLNWPDSMLEQFCAFVKNQMAKKAQEMAAIMVDDFEADLSHFQREITTLKQQKVAVEELQRLRPELSRNNSSLAGLKQNVAEAIVDDPEMSSSACKAAVAQFQAVSRTVKQLRADMIRHLQKACILVGEGSAARLDCQFVQSTPIAIRSTQTSPTAFVGAVDPSQSLNEMSRTQIVQQTQVSYIDQQRYRTGPDPKDINAYFSPSRKARNGTEPGRAMTDQTRSLPIWNESRVQQRRVAEQPNFFERATKSARVDVSDYGVNEQDFEDDEEALFQTRMGSPQSRFFDDDDDFGNDIDDEEMLDVATDAENLGRPRSIIRASKARDIFRETPGNEGPPKPPRSAKCKQPAKMSLPDTVSHLMQYSWSNDVKDALTKRFKLRGFRNNQLEAINATLGGKDAFILMPTGGGKSLCYQLPAIVTSGKTRGMTIVISPLISLMEDQVAHLKDLHIQAAYINGECSLDERKFILSTLSNSRADEFLQLLYVTPEMVNHENQTMIKNLQRLHGNGKLARIVIDEAHCVSQWGHDFRPDYKAIGGIRRHFPDVPFMALTATATENVKLDVIHNLGMRGCETFHQSFNRPNLMYEVRPKGAPKALLKDIVDIIAGKYKGQAGIVYCLSRKKCEEVAKHLQENGIKAHHYHAMLEPQEKRKVQQAWQNGRYKVIVATIAFGMGIDKADVRFVIHHTIPFSLEGYYQETGRAGRDGKKSGCYMFFNYGDVQTLKSMIDNEKDKDKKNDPAQKQRRHQMLRNVLQFCDNRSDCRRVQVLQYFNENFPPENCKGTCDNCNSTSTFETRDFTDYANAAIEMVKEIQDENVTLHQCVDIFRGAKKLKNPDWSNLDGYAVGSDYDRSDVERFFGRLLFEDALTEYNEMNRAGFATAYIRIGRRYRDFRPGSRKLKIEVCVSPAARGKSKVDKGPKKPRATKHETGVAAAKREYPASTNVSSPVQAASRRRRARLVDDDEDGDVGGFHPNGYEDDGFVVGDNENSDDGFEPVRNGPRRLARSTRPRSPGPPITVDQKMAQLPDVQRYMVEDFVVRGGQLGQQILMNNGLRARPFSDTILREMAINSTQSLEQMAAIPNINAEMVRLHGRRFLKLINEYHAAVEEAMQGADDRDIDPNHRNTIDLTLSDEEVDASGVEEEEEDDEGDYGDFPSDDDDPESPPGEQSIYFSSITEHGTSNFEPAPHQKQFMDRLSQLQESRGNQSQGALQSRTSAPDKKSSRGKGKGKRSYSRGGYGKGSSGGSRARSGSNTQSRITKIATSGPKRGSATRTGSTQRRPGGGGGGMGGIGMMPV